MDKKNHALAAYRKVKRSEKLKNDLETIEDLIKEGFPKRVTDAIDLVTMNGMVYHDRIKVIATNEIARAIKLKDLEHNLKPTRLKGLRKKDHDRIEKYHTAYTYLKD